MHIFLYSVRFHVSVQDVVIAPFVVFLRPVLCFRGARRSAMMLSCVFATSRTICAFFFSVEFLLGTFRWVFLCFFVSWTNLLVFERPAVLVFCIVDPQGHVFVPAGAARPPTRRQMGSQSRFLSLPGGRFSDHFSYFFVFFGILRFCEM